MRYIMMLLDMLNRKIGMLPKNFLINISPRILEFQITGIVSDLSETLRICYWFVLNAPKFFCMWNSICLTCCIFSSFVSVYSPVPHNCQMCICNNSILQKEQSCWNSTYRCSKKYDLVLYQCMWALICIVKTLHKKQLLPLGQSHQDCCCYITVQMHISKMGQRCKWTARHS